MKSVCFVLVIFGEMVAMKIENVSPCSGEFIEMDEGEYTDYKRYAADCWDVRMGESWESVYRCEELEKMYQEFKNRK